MSAMVARSAILDLLKNALLALTDQVKRVPFFIWLYLGGLALLYRQLRFEVLGYGTKRKSLKDGKAVSLTREENLIAASVIDAKALKQTFDDVGGLEEVKEALKMHVVWPMHNPQVFGTDDEMRTQPKGVLLYGPPGTGKTMLARALAKELGHSFLDISPEQLFAKWVGESEKLVSAIFSLAGKIQPCVVFVDEIDSLLGARSMQDNAVYTHAKTIFMTKWDGLQSDGRQSVIVVGATNREHSLDEAILRRLPLRLRVGPPNIEARSQILNLQLKSELSRLDSLAAARLVSWIAERTEGYSGSDLKELSKVALTIQLRSVVKTGTIASKDDLPLLTTSHFSEALGKIGASSSF